MNTAKWQLVHEYGSGSKVYIDENSIKIDGHRVCALVRHTLDPLGFDKISQQPVKEILFEKEFDLSNQTSYYHSIQFTHENGNVTNPMPMQGEWSPADQGTSVELEYLRKKAAPAAHLQEATGSTEKRKRGFWLTTMLLLAFVANPLAAFMYFANPELASEYYPRFSGILPNIMGMLAVVNLISAIAIWCWKRAGVYVLLLASSVVFGINLYIGVDLGTALFGVAGAAVTLLAAKARWRHFD